MNKREKGKTMWNIVDETGEIAASFDDRTAAETEARLLTDEYLEDYEAGFVDDVPSFRVVMA